MSSTIYGHVDNSIVANADFRARNDGTGKWTATQTYTIKRGDFSIVADFFKKGELITGIYPEVDAYFTGLVINSHEYSEMPGGLDKISVDFVGYEEGDETQSERETVYDYNVDLTERPIIEHPKFLALYERNKVVLVDYYEGKLRVKTTDGFNQFIDNYTGAPNTSYDPDIDAVNTAKWFKIIVTNGKRTYNYPVASYTETKTDVGGLSDAKVAEIGKIDDPPNSPATPPDRIWFLSGATETRSSTNPITYSRTWTTIEDDEDHNVIYGDG